MTDSVRAEGGSRLTRRRHFMCTGVTSEDHLLGPKKSSTVPTYIVNSLGDFKVLVDEGK